MAAQSNANRQIIRSLLVVTGFLLFAKFLGAGKDIAFAYRFGVGEVLDLYSLAIVIVTWLPLIVVGMLQTVMIPIITKLDVVPRHVFHRQMLSVIVGLGCLFAIITWVVAPGFVSVMAKGFNPSQQEMLIDIVRVMIPIVVMTCISALFSSELLARGNHSNTLLEGVPALVLLIVVLFDDSESMSGLVWGTLLGWGLHLVCLGGVFHFKYQKIRMAVNLKSPVWARMFRGASILFLGTMATSFVLPLDQFFAGQLGEGAVSTLGYASRLLSLGTGLAITVVGRALLPVLCRQELSEGERSQIALRWSNGFILAGIVGVLIAWPITEWAVGLIYERGQFQATDTQAVATLIQLGLLQLPFLFGSMVYVQYFSSRQMFTIVAISGIVAISVKLLTGFALVALYQLDGVMYSTIAMQFASLLYFMAQHHIVSSKIAP